MMKRILLVAAVVGLFTTVSPSVRAECSITDHYCNDEYEDQRDTWQDRADDHQRMMDRAAEDHEDYLRDQEEYERDRREERRHNEVLDLLRSLQ